MEITSLQAKKSAYYTWDKTAERGKGRLGVKVTPKGTKTFTFRYFKNSNPSFIRIGTFPQISLAKARKVAESYSNLLDSGTDPIEYLEQKEVEQKLLERQLAQSGSLEQLIEAYTKDKKDRGKRNYKEDKRKIERYIYPYIDPTRKAKDFEATDFLEALAIPIREGHGPKSNKLRSFLHAAFEFGLKNDNNPAFTNTEVKFGIKYNPIASIPKQTHAEKTGERFLSLEELIKLLHDMDHRYDDLNLAAATRRFIKFCFYAGGQRPYELANTLWRDVNFTERTLTIRPEVFKTGRAHDVPLTDTALNILAECHKDNTFNSPYVFHKRTAPNEPMPTNTLAQALLSYKKVTDIENFIGRDFRRTFKTLGGLFKISKEIRDRIQGHAISDVSGRHYDRYQYLDEKREGLEVWEKALNQELDKFQND